MYHLVIAQCIKTLKQIETYLDRAEKFATGKDFDIAVLVNDRLAPDMKNFIYQVQSACGTRDLPCMMRLLNLGQEPVLNI